MKKLMKEINQTLLLGNKERTKQISIDIENINIDYFKDANGLIECYFNVIDSYFKSNIIDFVEFLKYSEKNSYISDFIKDCDFELVLENIEDSEVELIKDSKNQLDFINMGTLIIDKYKIYCTGSYLYIMNLKTNKKYFYYCD